MRPFELEWNGGEHKFMLTIDHLKALQQKCDAGPFWSFKRLRGGDWRVDDVIQPIRLGLEGGGKESDEATELVRQAVHMGSFRKTWAGGEHRFRLSLNLARDLEKRLDAGLMTVLKRHHQGAALVEDIIEPIRLGLFGGGLELAEADKLVERHIPERGLLLSAPLAEDILACAVLGKHVRKKDHQPLYLQVQYATAILGHALFDDGDDPVGESVPAVESQDDPGRAVRSDGAKSTDGEPPSGDR